MAKRLLGRWISPFDSRYFRVPESVKVGTQELLQKALWHTGFSRRNCSVSDGNPQNCKSAWIPHVWDALFGFGGGRRKSEGNYKIQAIFGAFDSVMRVFPGRGGFGAKRLLGRWNSPFDSRYFWVPESVKVGNKGLLQKALWHTAFS